MKSNTQFHVERAADAFLRAGHRFQPKVKCGRNDVPKNPKFGRNEGYSLEERQ